jgi:hypothetical protein
MESAFRVHKRLRRSISILRYDAALLPLSTDAGEARYSPKSCPTAGGKITLKIEDF